MGKNFRIGWINMNHEFPFHFEFTPSEDSEDLNNGCGKGVLYVLGEPYWHSGSGDVVGSIDWTWVDLLEYVALNWVWLVFEQSYPYDWLKKVSHPGDIWNVAEDRWSKFGEETAEIEEAKLLVFDRRHNLAYAWKGLSLPSVTLMRNGMLCWVCAEGKNPFRASFSSCRDELISICDLLAKSFECSNNHRVMKAVRNWRNRDEIASRFLFESATGLSKESLNFIQGGVESFEFWGVAANDHLMDGLLEEGPLLAAARMTAGILDDASILRVLNAIREIQPGSIDKLEKASAEAQKHLMNASFESPFQHGYAVAGFIRKYFDVHHLSRFEIEAILVDLGVDIVSISLQAKKIDAVAVWGSRGPCVILNKDREHTAQERTRMTLVHEFGHLILDRLGGLPFCEVLGGSVDSFMESRAFAFAAELLLPRSSVEFIYRNGNFESIHCLMNELKERFGVSKSVACAQIHNSQVFSLLSVEDQNFARRRLYRASMAEFNNLTI